MVFEIMALVKATQLAITGPGLALRGPEGSMTRAIRLGLGFALTLTPTPTLTPTLTLTLTPSA